MRSKPTGFINLLFAFNLAVVEKAMAVSFDPNYHTIFNKQESQ